MKYYKVVRPTNNPDVYLSAISASSRKIVLSYRIGQWTQPKIKGSDLFCFDNLQAAKLFLSSLSCSGKSFFLFEVEVASPRKTGLFLYYACSFKSWFKKLAQYRINKKAFKRKMEQENSYYRRPPKGTVFCKGVKLVEKVPE
jgi:hypothetical protein